METLRFGLAVMLLCTLGERVRAQTTYVWTQNSAGIQDWTTVGNWDSNGVFVSGTTNRLQFFADTTTALASGTNSITTNVPSTFTMNQLTFNGLGATATGPTNITIGTSSATWTLGGTTPTVNLNGLTGTQGLSYTVASNLVLGANTTFTGSGTAGFTFSGILSGSSTLSKAGTSTLILQGTNTYSGMTTVTSGTLVGTSATKAFGTNGTVSIGSLGTLSLRNDSTVSFTNGSSAYTISNTGSGATINVDRVSGIGSNTITVGNLTTSSTAAMWGLNFTGANGVNLSAGTLTTPTSSGTSVHTITNTISGGGMLTLAGVTRGGTTGSRTLQFDGTGNTTVTGGIAQASGGLKLTKSGTGILTLEGTNSYTGDTSITNGTLLITGNSSAVTGAITVSNGATFGGSGSIGGATTVSSGGTITAGTALATPGFNINAATALSAGATYQVKLFGTGEQDISLLSVNGNVSINDTATTGSRIKLDLSALSASDVAILRQSVSASRTYTVMQATGGNSINNFDPSNFSISNLGYFDSSEWSLVTNPSSGVQLQFTPVPVPEPAAVLGIAAAALGVGGFVRRKLRNTSVPTSAA